MTEEDRRIPDETLAAFIDNALPVAERARVAAILATDHAQRDLLLTAASVSADAAAATASPNATPWVIARTRVQEETRTTTTTSRSGILLVLCPMLLAASLVAFVYYGRSAPNAPRATPDAFVLLSAAAVLHDSGANALERTYGTHWDEPGWRVVRGGRGMELAAGVRARIGARAVELELAALARDTVAARRAATALESLLGAAPGAKPLMVQLQAQPIVAHDKRQQRNARLRTLSGDTAAFDAGAWLESARIALLSNRADFLAPDGAARYALRRVIWAVSSSRDAADWPEAIDALKALDATSTADVSTLRQLVAAVMAALPGEGDPQRE